MKQTIDWEDANESRQNTLRSSKKEGVYDDFSVVCQGCGWSCEGLSAKDTLLLHDEQSPACKLIQKQPVSRWCERCEDYKQQQDGTCASCGWEQ